MNDEMRHMQNRQLAAEGSTVRATVRTDADGLTAITTMSKGAFKTVFYTAEESAALVEAILSSVQNPLTTVRVEWGKDRE